MDSGASKDNLKWFGEGFDGFPKRLPEDTVEYAVYVVDNTLSDSQVRARLNAILQASNELSKKLLKDYIWQRDDFKLELKRENNIWALFGRTNHGDSVDDEWLIVYLLRELSSKFKDAWIRVYDADGEFLLIEAANVLPKWLNPEVAENRVWLHSGNLNVIPLKSPAKPSKPGEVEKKPLSTDEALEVIKSQSAELIHSPLIENEAFYRIRNHPGAISSTFHRGQVRIPRKLAYLLRRKPSLVSPAIEAFYLRDPISMRALHGSETPNLTFGPTDLIVTTIQFTKVGFAQMRSQRYVPPKVWADTLPTNATPPVSATPKIMGETEMGMKLACGFDMLVSDPQKKSSKPVREIQLLIDDIESGEEALPTDAEIARWWTAPPDSEAWLDIDYASFEKELSGGGAAAAGDEAKAKKAAGPNAAAGTEGFGDRAAQENLRKMVQRFEAFLNDDKAGVEGAEFSDDMDMDDDDDDDDEDDTSDSEEDRDVSFDEAEFGRIMREMMGFPAGVPPGSIAKTTKNMPQTYEEESDDEDSGDEGSEYDDSENEGVAVEREMNAIEKELKGLGALNLNPPEQKTEAPRLKGKGKEAEKVNGNDVQSEDDSDAEVDVDFNLAKNMLESLKGQGGLAGPAGNMMGLMGISMPPDEDENEKSKKK